MTPRKPTAGFWTTAALVVVLVGYPLSFGPACWWFSTVAMPNPIRYASLTTIHYKYAPRFYWPIGWLAVNGPNPIRRAIRWYAKIGIERIFLPVDSNGEIWSAA